MNKDTADKIDNMKTDDANNSKALITKDMNLADVLFKYPETAEVFTDYGLHCVGCFAASFDTIEMGAKIHQLTDDEIKEMIERVNEVAQEGE